MDLEGLGAVPIAMSGRDIYSSMEKGLLAGSPFSWSGIPPNRLYEVSGYVIDNVAMGVAVMGMAMNKDTWGKLSPDLQAIVLKLGQEAALRVGASMDTETNLAKHFSAGKGMEAYNLSSEELAKFNEITGGVADKWAVKRQAEGLPAKELLDVVRKSVEKHTKRWD